VVVAVAHHLELELAPAQQRLLQQDLVDRAGVEPLRHPLAELGRRARAHPRGPPSVKAGRTISGRPMSSIVRSASAIDVPIADCGTRRPAETIVSRNSSRSSARLDGGLAPPTTACAASS